MSSRGVLLAMAMLLCGCDAREAAPPAPGPPAGVSASRLDALLGAAHDGFARALAPRVFRFPEDHGGHPDFRHEWWYLTGNLDDPAGERFGFELTIFRFALAPPSVEPAGGSAWRTRQVYMAHFALTDVARGRFTWSERFARGALGLAGAGGEPLRVWLEDWSIEQAAGDPLRWRLHAAHEAVALDLELDLRAPRVLNGEQGLSRKSASGGAASYYYSMPRLPARGRLVRDGSPREVSGLAWLDREWGSGGLDASQEGWDWFALQLDGGGALMLYALRLRGGGLDPMSGGTWLAPDGSTRTLGAADYRIDVLDRWESPRGGRYPARWRVRAAPLALDLEVQPVLADQELGAAPRYWEGAVDVSGTRADARVGGRGYVELVGYAR
jgi:predicted secreted hydrolase